ncbi:MAG: 4Fe-4S dicluster domain-containing protein [Candidatus Sumerlaeaceae bacterium]|jgi:Na+-translocating ferredoxin:NAD+ oxidoreductase RnfC subunit
MTFTPESVFERGIVGAGGAGFPTHVKMRAQAECFILNAAECEPLLHKDKELLAHHSDVVIEGMKRARGMIGARRCVIGIKDKYVEVIAQLERVLPEGFEIARLRDTYPAGDEFLLVYDVTKRVIPPGGLPLNVGCVVNNVETMFNLGSDEPVIDKFLTVTGAVRQPVTLRVPIGTHIRDVIAAAGGAAIESFAVLLNGVMMGRLCSDLDTPVTKTTGGVYVLPPGHFLVRRYSMSTREINRIGRSACDQCSFCTEMCPRYLLGHPIEPHKAMRALGFTMDKAPLIVGTTYCCECNICTMIACPEDLDPRNVCVQDKAVVKQMGLKWESYGRAVEPHPMYEARRTPTKRLMVKLGLSQFVNEGPLQTKLLSVARVRIPLKQHVGTQAEAVVSVGDRVRRGQLIGRIPNDQLGAPIHASIEGTVTKVSDFVEITA